MKVLAIAHNCVGASNRRKFDALAEFGDLDITLLTPPWWFEEGRVNHQDTATPRRYRLEVGKAAFTNNGTRHFYLSQLPGLIAGWRPDVIDVHEEPFSAAAFQTVLLRDLLAPHAAVLFCSYVNLRRGWRPPYRWFERFVLARADAAYVPSSEVPPVLRSKGFSGPIQVIPMGVDLARFTPGDPSYVGYSKHGPPRRIGFLGRLEAVKGLPILLQAAARLTQPFRLVIVGDGPERERLEADVRRLSLRERVEFRRAIPFEGVPDFLRSLDVLVLPSITIPPAHKEQFGRVLVEAMACGVPVVGSSSGGIPEVIGDAGLVFPEGEPASLAAALEEILASDARRQELRSRGTQRAGDVYAWPGVASKYREFYAHVHARRQYPAAARGAAAGTFDAGKPPPG